ncbi:MAG: hypothetical protein ACOCYR_06295 [Erythrobacter sp.]
MAPDRIEHRVALRTAIGRACERVAPPGETHLAEHDRAYATGEARRFLSLRNAAEFPGADVIIHFDPAREDDATG